MRLSTSTDIYCLRPGTRAAEPASALAIIANAGYKLVDLSFQDAVRSNFGFTGEKWREWVEDLRQCAESHGVEFAQAHLPVYNNCDRDFPDRERLAEMTRRSVEAAGALKIPWIVAHAGTAFDSVTPSRDSLKRNVEYFSPLIEQASQLDVGIAFENLWELPISPTRRYTSEPEELLELVETFADERVGICWDFAHASYQKQDMYCGLKLFGSLVKVVHVSDHLEISDNHLLPYSGKIDWSLAMDALAESGYAGNLNFELHSYVANLPEPLVLSAIRHSHAVGEYLITLFESAKAVRA